MTTRRRIGPKQNQPKIQVIPDLVVDDKKFPFALVFYSSDKTKGVVATKDIFKKNRIVGNLCKAPNPIDLGIQSKERHDAYVVSFGHDIEFLYGIKLLKTGQVDPKCISEKLLAKKKEISQTIKSQEETRRLNLLAAEDEITKSPQIIVLDKTTGTDVPKEVSSTEKNESVQGTVEVIETLQTGTENISGTNRESVIDTTPEVCKTGTNNDNATSLTENTTQVTDKSPPRLGDAPTNSKDTSVKDKVDVAISCDMTVSTSEISVQCDLSNTLGENEEDKDEQPEDNLAFDLNDLECSKPGPDKFNLAAGRDIYIDKADYTSLPSLFATKALFPAGSTGRTPRGMVSYIIKFLLPKDKWANVLRSNIPKLFVRTIRDFLNRRLPDDYKVNLEATKGFIYDACRTVKRDRKREKQNREKKIADGLTIKKRRKATQMTIVINGEEIPLSY